MHTSQNIEVIAIGPSTRAVCGETEDFDIVVATPEGVVWSGEVSLINGRSWGAEPAHWISNRLLMHISYLPASEFTELCTTIVSACSEAM